MHNPHGVSNIYLMYVSFIVVYFKETLRSCWVLSKENLLFKDCHMLKVHGKRCVLLFKVKHLTNSLEYT